MTCYDISALIIAIRAALPVSNLKIFEETLCRAVTSPMASDDFRFAAGIEPRETDHRPFRPKVITGGRA